MKKFKRFLPVLVIALLLIPTVVFAKGIGSLTITGPGIKGELTINDPRRMEELDKAGFFDQAVLSKPPTGLNMDAGYSVTISIYMEDDYAPYVEMDYYPTQAGQPAYVHYTGRFQEDALQPVDEWGLVNRGADRAFRELMEMNNVTLQSALAVASVKAESPAEAPSVSPDPGSSNNIVLSIAAIAILMIAAGLVVRRRAVSGTAS